MKTKFLPLLSLLFVGFSTVSCSKEYIKKLLIDNPDILADAIKANGKEVLDALQKASEGARQAQLAEAEKKRQEQRENEFKNPKKPKMADNRAYFGDKKAPITIVEYSDFQCGFCKRAGEQSVKQVLDQYKGKVRVLYKHLPLDFHKQAMIAAQYYEAVAKVDQTKARAFHDKIFEKQNQLSGGAKFLDKLVGEVGLSVAKVKAELENVKPLIQEDMAEATQFGFRGTPAFLVGGVTLSGAQPFSEFKSVIDRHLSDMNK